ncbi:hypothetical protein BLNAU_21102 [Blattamonas nauphoetae]|uniref:Uncharacterized protein n=1 Tax=Blattamonas nauphoetae TaxID=2049346 RepID=A0ABQ9WWQ8_9EUKA|nr:hypothetical protein BLNAU_21102 [Blattamonas nauphoetae]
MKSMTNVSVTTAEKNPLERFDELLGSYSNPHMIDPQWCHNSLVDLLQRYLNHMTKEQRNDLLRRFGAEMSRRDCQNVNVDSLATIVSSDEDVIALFHTSGISHSILRQIQPNQTNNHRLIQLVQLSEIFSLVSIEALSEDLPSFFRNLLCETEQYLENDDPNGRSSFSSFVDILCNEVMACVVLGIDDRDPVERIAAFINLFHPLTLSIKFGDINHSMNLLSQCLQHTATFLNAHPDLFDSFLSTVDLSSSPSDTPFRHDRHLNLISALSQSSSPLFTKLSEPLLDPTFHLHSLLTPRSFTDPASSFIRMASTNPSFFRRIVETHAVFVLDLASFTAVRSVRVVPDSPSEPHCVDFGRMTQNWIVLLKAMAEAKLDLTLHSKDFNSLPLFLLTLLVLSAASTNDELSSAAVSVFSNQFGLSTPHTEALLFATPTTFPINDAFTPRHSHELEDSEHANSLCQSICAEAGRCVALMSLSDISLTDSSLKFAGVLGPTVVGCLVNALHSTTTFPHSFPFFSPELRGLSQRPSVWNDSSQPSALAALTTLADIEISLAFNLSDRRLNMSPEDESRRHTILIHLFPFLGPESQTKFLSSFHTFYRSKNQKVHHSFPRMVEGLLEMATVNSYNTPIALLKEMRRVTELVIHTNPVPLSFGNIFTPASPFEESIVERLKTAEGEERWRLLTQLIVVSRSDFAFADELMRTENDAKALLILSVPMIRITPRPNLHLNTNLAAFDRIVELAGHVNNLHLIAAALPHIVDTVESCIHPPVTEIALSFRRKQALQDVVFHCLRAMHTRRRERVEEGGVAGKDEVSSQIVGPCLKLMQFLMNDKSIDPPPFVDGLVSLALTADLSLLRSILLVLQEFEERTRNTPMPFSITRATTPFKGIRKSFVTQQPLPSIVASILLSAGIDEMQTRSQQKVPFPSSGFFRLLTPKDDSKSLPQLLRGLNETLISDIAKETAMIVCLIVVERKKCSSQVLNSDESSGTNLDHLNRHATSQQLFLTLLGLIFPVDPSRVSASTLLPLAPFLTRILTIVVPSSPDRTELCSVQVEHSQLLNSFLSLVLSLIRTGTPSTLSTHPLSSLLSVLSIALVRLDTIPSSLPLFNRFCDLLNLSDHRSNPTVRHVVLALCQEGMEDRSNLSLDTFQLTFLNVWTGANVQRHVDRMIPHHLAVGAFPLAWPNRLVWAVGPPVHQPPIHPPAAVNAPRVDGFGVRPLPRFGQVQHQHDEPFHRPQFGRPASPNPD